MKVDKPLALTPLDRSGSFDDDFVLSVACLLAPTLVLGFIVDTRAFAFILLVPYFCFLSQNQILSQEFVSPRRKLSVLPVWCESQEEATSKLKNSMLLATITVPETEASLKQAREYFRHPIIGSFLSENFSVCVVREQRDDIKVSVSDVERDVNIPPLFLPKVYEDRDGQDARITQWCVDVFVAAQRTVPLYLTMLHEEITVTKTGTAIFGFC